jgi:hypothetical protein
VGSTPASYSGVPRFKSQPKTSYPGFTVNLSFNAIYIVSATDSIAGQQDVSAELKAINIFFSSRIQKTLVQDMEMEQDTLLPIYEANCPTVNKNVSPFFKISVHFQLNGF